MKKILFLITLISQTVVYGQDCDCTSNFEWVKETIEENDAGFQFVIDKKGEEAYEQHNRRIKDKISKLENSDGCVDAINKWLAFFRSEHISFKRINSVQPQSENKPSNQEIIESYKDWQKVEIDLDEFKKYLSNKEQPDFEGIWATGSYTIGIIKKEDKYLGFIIEADGVYWTPGQVKFIINKDFSSTYYMRDHSAQNIELVELIGNNYIETGIITLKRISPDTTTEPEIERYMKAISAENPYFEKINNETTLLRIPRFWGPVRQKIDSVINANRETILSSPNLIIDLRNNGGGSDRNYRELIPFLYTNPIRVVGAEFLSTPLNNQRMLDIVNKDLYGLDEEVKKWAQKSYDTLSKHIGEFVNLDEKPVRVTTLDTVLENPKNIGIIINEGIGSTTEQFLLAAKQSKKVKLFGTTTMGVLDISNMYFVKSPCKDYELGYSLSKSMRIPEMTIDDKGIQPDFYIDKEIPKYEWIKFVTEILNE
ncbi:S41 family peptidase [Zunongwangia sp.]|uniref:S41 family peptidase n=1 Tax=Zunongwangia sp. TaxID=1965325 RepID=UPI003AA8E240